MRSHALPLTLALLEAACGADPRKEHIYATEITATGGDARIVRVDDMTGKGWITLGRWGAGEPQFRNLCGVYVRGSLRRAHISAPSPRARSEDHCHSMSWKSTRVS